ncbi:MAG: hypothetical protein AABZ64_06130 [Nitrospinota bacterium]
MIPSRLAARFSGLLLCGLLAGCAYEWRRPGTAPAQARRDGEECAVQAQAGARWARHYRFPPREVRRKIGDTIVTEREYPPESYVQSRLFAECMEKRGYAAVRKDAR